MIKRPNQTVERPDIAMLFAAYATMVTQQRLRHGQRGFDPNSVNPYWLRDLAGDFYSFAPTVFGGTNVWNDINVGVVSLRLGATAPDIVAINGTGLRGYGFDGATITEMMDGAIELEHDWQEESDIHFHLHWMPSTAAGGNVKWQLEYALADGAAVLASTTIDVTVAAGATAWLPQIASFPAIDTTGHGIGTQLVFRLFRDPTDGADTYGADAVIHGTAGIHYQIDSVGSRQIATK